MKTNSDIKTNYDVLVVGARVAGAATAMLLARAGKRVLVVDKSAYGSDTTSTHAIMRAGVMQLYRWGLLDALEAAGSPAIRRTTFHYAADAVEVEIKDRDGVGALYAPRRTVIDALLADAARDAGAQVEHGVTVRALLRDDAGAVCGVTLEDASGVSHDVEAGIVVGADGARSFVARSVDAPVLHEGVHYGSVIYGYYRGLGRDGTHWYYNIGGGAGLIPTNDDTACVFVGMTPERFATKDRLGVDGLFADMLRSVDPGLAEIVAASERAGKLHPVHGHAGFVRQSWGNGWALVGDSGCFKDPITAHGMTDALRDAELLANAILEGGVDALERYQRTRDDFAIEFHDLSERIAAFDWTLDDVKPMHVRLSRLMNSECDIVRGFDRTEEVASG